MQLQGGPLAGDDIGSGKLDQKGSDCNSDRLRFDFAWDDALTGEQIEKVEAIVNQQIKDNYKVCSSFFFQLRDYISLWRICFPSPFVAHKEKLQTLLFLLCALIVRVSVFVHFSSLSLPPSSFLFYFPLPCTGFRPRHPSERGPRNLRLARGLWGGVPRPCARGVYWRRGLR